MVIRRAPAAPLAGRVTTYYGFALTLRLRRLRLGRHHGCTDPQGHEWWFAQPIADG